MVQVKLVGLGIAGLLLLIGIITQIQKRRVRRLQLEKWQREWDGEEGFDDILGIHKVDPHGARLTRPENISNMHSTSHQSDMFPTDDQEPHDHSIPEALQDELYGELFILKVLAKSKKVFVGYELLQAMLSAGLRFGEMGIFHSYSPNAQGEEITFSVAQATEPGTFDIEQMGGVSCVGLTLFTRFNGDLSDTHHLSSMIETATQLAQDLDGVICDRSNEVLDADTLQKLPVYLKDIRKH